MGRLVDAVRYTTRTFLLWAVVVRSWKNTR